MRTEEYLSPQLMAETGLTGAFFKDFAHVTEYQLGGNYLKRVMAQQYRAVNT